MSPNALPRPIQIVWYKRDLRILDHAPLWEASQRIESHGAILPLYVVEPSVIHADDYDPAHWTFIRTCLQELRKNLAVIGQPLVVRVGEVLPVLETLRQDYQITHLWAYEETGNAITYARDRGVRRWAKEAAIPFSELPNGGVVRRLGSRDGWAANWEARMAEPVTPTPESLPHLDIDSGTIPTAKALGLDKDIRKGALRGGEKRGHEILTSFLNFRGANYTYEMSSPVTAFTSCSRISPYLAWGALSMKYVAQTARTRQQQIWAMPEEERRQLPGTWTRSLNSFIERLHWRDHFVQKLEDEPRIEFESFIPAYDALRKDTFNAERFEAWTTGHTGYPMIDACMRALNYNGWINFRMRAMLVSFASYDLWLPWQQPSVYLARVFLDYEPGIHFSQHQMQAGTTGINSIRMYNPTKQGKDHDNDGKFIREWIPELTHIPAAYIHAPWLMPSEIAREYKFKVGVDYPNPIVDHEQASKFAKDQIYALRGDPQIKEQAEGVIERHASRKPNRESWRRRRREPRPQVGVGAQLALFDAVEG